MEGNVTVKSIFCSNHQKKKIKTLPAGCRSYIKSKNLKPDDDDSLDHVTMLRRH